MTSPLLEVKNLSVQFGGLKAVNDVSFEVWPHEVFSLIGPNGAGKTTIFNLISSLYRPSAGRVIFEGEMISHLAPPEIARLGIARTFQNIELFEHATVLNNLLVGRHCQRHSSWWQDLLMTPRVRRTELQFRRHAEEVIDFLDLQHYRDALVASLPYGVRKVVELGRALAMRPKLLLLDEPSSGLNVEETEDMGFWIEDIKNDLGITVIMVEHDMSLVSRVSDRVLALNQGEVLALGSPAQVQADPGVIEAYLGGGDTKGGDGGSSLRDSMSDAAPDSGRPLIRHDNPPGPLSVKGGDGGSSLRDSMSDAAPDSGRPFVRRGIVLQLNNVESSYGPVKAIRGVSLALSEGSIVTVLGCNGAGKSTILKTISGIIDPQKGTVLYRGQAIQKRDPAWIVRQGIVQVPEGREIFPLLTVAENLLMGAYTRQAADRDAVAADMEAVFAYFPVLRERCAQPAGQLSGGQQQMLAISRALLARPQVMLLDEPSLGLSPKLTKEIFEILVRINRERGVTLLVVEQNAMVALSYADYGYVLEVGRIVMEDRCAVLREKDDIKEFYLGMKEAGARGTRRWKKKKNWR